jgi:tRNA modification GTPase
MDTIYALSSGSLPSGVAVIRLSGPLAFPLAGILCGGTRDVRRAMYRTIRSRNGEVLDQGLVLLFRGPHSFTGEDCLELQVHGGRAVVSRILDELSGISGLRHAEAGEFTRRAFENGKLDLVEAEGLADLISADTEMQRRLASEHARGGLSILYQGWARRLTHARAMIEAELDFADEDDIPGSVSERIWSDMDRLSHEIESHLRLAKTGEIIRDGFKVVLAGPPNSGKSSLLNALARRDIAIVTDIAGTTRDVLSVDISLEGFAVRLFDTAGIRNTDDRIEQEGIRRARQLLDDADLILWLSDDPQGFQGEDFDPDRTVRVRSKIDLGADPWDSAVADVGISTTESGGLDNLLAVIRTRLPDVAEAQVLAIPSRRRHAESLNDGLLQLRQALAAENELDIRSEHLRRASIALGRVTGRVDVEDLLDVIFSEFCIGK